MRLLLQLLHLQEIGPVNYNYYRNLAWSFKKQTFFIMSVLLTFTSLLSSCSSDQEITAGDADQKLVSETRSFLNGEIVCYTKATLSGVDKTYYDVTGGCPAVFKFNWSENDEQTVDISILDFTVGNMGMIINFTCKAKTTVLNSWEKKEYPGDNWIKFYGENGSCWGKNEDGSNFSNDESTTGSNVKGSFVQGYYNVKSHQIQFIISYNMMNVRSECPLQTIDKSLFSNYDKLKADYEVALKKAKEEAGAH